MSAEAPQAGLVLVVAVADSGVIGAGGALPWHLPEDLKHFKAKTLGHAVIMGRKTWESIGRPLPRRRNIVVTRQAGYVAEGAEVAHSLDEALALARQGDPEPRVIGGADLFRLALPAASRIYWTEVHRDVAGDVSFPPFDRAQWREVERDERGELAFVTLERRPEDG